ncbi:MAG TPA: lipid A biosynthesis acyltransferase [Burkholderiales bacterium]|nr:lipid A biosynthesis acyltransferase [Burkholderiales bacterium]
MIRLLVALMWLLHFLPLAALARVGRMLGYAAFWLIAERRRVTRINLARCFPDLQPHEREHLAREHFCAAARSIVELGLVWWASGERIRRLVRIEGLEHLRALGTTPSILFVPHFVGLNIGAARLGSEANCVSMYAAQKDPTLSELLLRGRHRFGTQTLVSRQEGIRGVIRAMRAGLPFYYLPDQDYGPRDALFVPFFGVQAATVPGLSRIARMVGARVLPCVTRMLPRGEGYVMTIEPPWENFPTADIVADTRRMNEYIERKVREMPEQYLWMHKRFKTRPPGEARFYPQD